MDGQWLKELEHEAELALPASVFRYFHQGARQGISAAEAAAVPVVRGRDGDPLGWLTIAHARWPADAVVRVVNDAPLSDPYVVLSALRLHATSRATGTDSIEALEANWSPARTVRSSPPETTLASPSMAETRVPFVPLVTETDAPSAVTRTAGAAT